MYLSDISKSGLGVNGRVLLLSNFLLELKHGL